MNESAKVDERGVPFAHSRPTVLVVDGDRLAARALESALAPCNYTVEWCRDGESALDTLRKTRVDVVVADSVLSDVSGLTLLRRANELRGPAAPAFIFVSIDRAIPTKVALLNSGALDYLIKPVAAEELRARIVNAVETRRASRALVAASGAGLMGDCEYVGIADMLTMLEFSQKSGVVHISSGVSIGRLYMDNGRIVHAEVGAVIGAEAFFLLLHQSEGIYRYEPGTFDGTPTLHARVSEMLMAAAVREDTDRHAFENATAKTGEASAVHAAPLSLRARSSTIVPMVLRTAISKLRIAIADTYSVGDLQLGTALPRTPHPLFHIELWTTLPEGIGLLLSLASPPGHTLLLAALSRHETQLNLHFETPVATLVVSLVDCEHDTPLPESRARALIVAPANGDLLTIAPERLAQLSSRFSPRPPNAMMVVGESALHATIKRWTTAATAHVETAYLNTHAVSDLRDSLVELLTLWGNSVAP